MTDPELKRRLAQLTPPVVDEAAKGRALHRATVALSQPAELAEATGAQRARWLPWQGWVAGVAMLAMLLIVGGRYLRVDPSVAAEAPSPSQAGEDLRMLAQVQGLFPGLLNAVIERNDEVKLDLTAERMAVADEQPLVVQLERGSQRLRVLSYSGRSVTVELKGKKITFEALVTSDGGVVLSGDDFVWSSAQPGLLAGYHVEARTLLAL